MLTIDIDYIQRALNNPLPGVSGQEKMAPRPSTNVINRWMIPDHCREAGVLLLLYPRPIRSWGSDGHLQEFYLAFTRRPDYLSSHKGQISFPGGRREEGESLEATALRETHEELGVSPDTIEIIGKLSTLYTPPSNYCIYPFVAFSSTRPAFQPNQVEVAELIEAPVSLLLDPANRKEETWSFENYGERQIPFFDIFGHKVWGATAMILSEFLMLLTN